MAKLVHKEQSYTGGDANAIHWSQAKTSVKKNYAQITANSASQHNITFTVADDGTVVANSGANTSTAEWSFHLNPHLFLKAGTYTLSDGDLGGSASTAFLQIVNATETAGIAENSTSHEAQFTLATDQYVVLRVYYKSGVTIDATFKPMIRLASISDSTYVPYIKDNVELDEDKAGKTQITNPNLLDNPWFTINQRGATTYPSTAWSMWLDRWRTLAGMSEITATLTDNGVQLVGTTTTYNEVFYQILEADRINDYSSPYTLSLMLSDGTVRSITGNINAPSGSYAIQFQIITPEGLALRLANDSNGTWHILLICESGHTFNHTIRAIKLEKSPVSTLGMDVKPNYATELLKCQRYYQRWSFPQYYTIGAVSASDSWIVLFVPSQKMRVLPTVVTTGTWYTVVNDTVPAYATSLGVAESVGGYNLSGARTSIGANTSGYAYAADAGGFVLELIADL